MKTFASKEKQSISAGRKARPYVHHPMGAVQQAQQAEVSRILRSTGAQARLSIGQPDDKYEQEADRVADQVMRMPDPKLQRQPENEEEEEMLQAKPLADQITPLVQRQEEPEEEEEAVQAKAMSGQETAQRQPMEEEEEELQAKEQPGHTPQATPDVAANIQSLKGGGQPLADSSRSFFEPRFGQVFRQVRIHTDAKAASTAKAVNARAFTLGQDIVFGAGEYSSSTFSGRRLLAHELVHVIQQNGGENAGLKSTPFSNRIQKDQNDDEGLTGEFFNLSGVETVRANMEIRFLKTAAYASLGLRTGDRVKAKLLSLSRQYERAYENYAVVVRAAGEEAQNQEQWINIGVGIGAGVLLGIGAAFLFPTSAAGWMAISAGEAIGAAGSAAGQAAAGAFLTSRVADALSVPGTDLEPGGLDPKIIELQIWRNVSNMYRSAISLNSASTKIHLLSNAAEYLIGEIRVHVAGGSTDMSQDSVFDMMETLVIADNAMSRFDTTLSRSLTNLRQLKTATDSISLSDYPRRNMEQDIWILWMSELDDSSILDLDEIEDYLHGDIGVLGSSGLLGVDFGSWTSSADERSAWRAARRHASRIRRRLRMFEGQSL